MATEDMGKLHVGSRSSEAKGNDKERANGGGDDAADDGIGGGGMYSELNEFMEAIEARLGWPSHVNNFVRQVMIARGGAKALIIRSQLRTYGEHLNAAAADFTAAVDGLAALRTVEDVLTEDIGAVSGRFVSKEEMAPSAVKALQAAGKADKALNLLVGCEPVMRDLVRWVSRICEDPNARLFVAGDGGAGSATDFVPEGFEVGALIAAYKPVAAKWAPEMYKTLEAAGEWPPREQHMYMQGSQPCRHCGGSFSNLWVSNRACFRCEGEMRAAGKCPVSSKCPPGAFCPHAHRCIACERWSCDACGITCGRGLAGIMLSPRHQTHFRASSLLELNCTC